MVSVFLHFKLELYDYWKQLNFFSFTDAIEYTRHPSLSRTPTIPSISPSILPPPSFPSTQQNNSNSSSSQLELIKSSYQPSPSGVKHKASSGSRTPGGSSSGGNPQTIYANIPSPVTTTSFINSASCKERYLMTFIELNWKFICKQNQDGRCLTSSETKN